MYVVEKETDLEIDHKLYYDKERNLMCIPEDDEDDIFAGTYMLRRYPSEGLSLEYLSYYQNGVPAEETTIALVSLISTDQSETMLHLEKIKAFAPKAFVLNARIYVGCMH